MLQESSFARQTRRPIFSLEAGPPRETGCSSAAGHVRQPASAIHAVRMDGGSPGPARVGEPPMAQERSGALPWTGSASNEGEGMFLASKAAWAGVVFIFLATGISGPRPTPLASKANLSKEEPGVGVGIGTMSRRCRKLCAIKDTTEAKLMASSVYGPERVFARIRRLRICQSPGRLIPGLQTDSVSDLRVTWRLATRLRKVNLRQA